jgi:propanol-preferring alcohol dehydrogenase
MKAAVVRKSGEPLDVREVDRPEAGQGQIVVQVETSGVCHTDLHAANGDWPVRIFRTMREGTIEGRIVMEI